MNPDQLTILDQPRARHDDPPTSKAAARRVDAAKTRAAILGVLTEPLTAEEIADRVIALHPTMRRDSIVTAVSRQKNKGLIVNTGITRASSANCQRIVWRLA